MSSTSLQNKPENEVTHQENIQIARDVSTSATGVRLQLWSEALELFAKHPLGVTNANIEVRVFYGVPDYAYYNLHNGFITLLVASGAIGFLLIMVFGVCFFLEAAKYLLGSASMEKREGIALLMACAVAVLAGDLVNGCFVLWRGSEYLFLWLVLGEIYGTIHPENELPKGRICKWITKKSLKNS